MKNVLIIGASRGIGAELTQYFSEQAYHVIGVSRGQANHCQWIQADISTARGVETVINGLAQTPIDALIFSSGIWEDDGFTQAFDFRKTQFRETRDIMQVNLVAPIEISKGLAKNLAMADNPRAIYLGALSGLEHKTSDQVAYSASKFGLRGAIQALGEALQKESIGFSVINLGNVATPEVLEDMAAGVISEQTPIAISDIIRCIEMIFSLSPSVNIGDINLSQKPTVTNNNAHKDL